MQFENSVALVTGGGRGIGQAVALAFADAGADVAVADMDAAIAQETADLVEQTGRRSVAIGVDVREPDSVQAMVESTQKALGDLDIAVNNAGVISIKGIAELGADDWDQVMAVNARGVPVHKGRSGRDAAS
jgi:meso-butanediol dehydrogenase/(S,S)-butanediol dehydrogenase/diacetyl reductase